MHFIHSRRQQRAPGDGAPYLMICVQGLCGRSVGAVMRRDDATQRRCQGTK